MKSPKGMCCSRHGITNRTQSQEKIMRRLKRVSRESDFVIFIRRRHVIRYDRRHLPDEPAEERIEPSFRHEIPDRC